MNDQEHDYLWDGSGAPDPEVQQFERMLGTLRHRGAPPPWPAREGRPARRPLVMLAAAAALVLAVAGGVWLAMHASRAGWDVEVLAGRPSVDGADVSGTGRLHAGEWLVTDADSRARLELADIGQVDVDPNSRLQLVRAREREHRLSLVHGTIHAQIWAPPNQFFVNTPSSVTVDLGCAYTLQVDEKGAGLVRVTIGWVGFQFNGREAFIPEGAVCATRPGIGPGTPRYEDAPEGYDRALAVLDFAPRSDPRRTAALDLVLQRARRRDAFTLWHLLTRGTPDERARVYERMAALAPPPAGVTRDGVLAGDRTALDRWWDSLGLEDTSWWRLLERKW